MISLRRLPKEKLGDFKSYAAIGAFLSVHGETGLYYAIPGGIISIAGMKEITVTKHSKNDIEIVMDGSNY